MPNQVWIWLIVVIVVGIAVLVARRLTRHNPEAQPTGERPDAPGNRTVPGTGLSRIPYGIAQRPMPQGDDPNKLLPQQVGPFVRESVKPGPVPSTYANYRSDTAKVFVELAVCSDSDAARAGIDSARGETPEVEPVLFVKGPGVSCMKMVIGKGVLLAWTRGRYYISANTGDGEQELDAFMAAFPY